MRIKTTDTGMTRILLFAAALCLAFAAAHGQQKRPNRTSGTFGGAEPFLLVSGSRDADGDAGTRHTAPQGRAQEAMRPLSQNRRHPAEILSCAPGFFATPREDAAPASDAPADDARPTNPTAPRDGGTGQKVFFFGDSAGFLSKHIVTPHSPERDHAADPAASADSAAYSVEMEGIWQVSDLPIRCIAPHPGGKLIAVYESDGFSAHRVSLWDWENKTRLYAKRFHDSVNSIDWSAAGNFLMVGNTSFEGITILDGAEGTPKQVFQTSPGIINLGATGKSERSIITYAAAGRIVYTNVSTGETLGEYATEPDLRSTELCNNNRTIIGFTDNQAVALNATNGETLSLYDAENPTPAVSSDDTEPVWFERKRDVYGDTLVWYLRKGGDAPVAVPLPQDRAITSATGGGDFRIFGTSTGDIYLSAGASLVQEDSHTISPVTGICDFEDGFYFLCDGKLFFARDCHDTPAALFDSRNGTFSPHTDSITRTENGFLLWSSSAPAPVVFWNGETDGDGAAFTELYKAGESVSSLSATKNGIAFVEGSARAVCLGDVGAAAAKADRGVQTPPFRYSGAGLQDAVMVSDTYMLVSKSAGLRSPYPLMFINVNTGETVPLYTSGDICFSLSMADEQRGYAYAFIVKNEDEGRTQTELIFIRVNLENFTRTQIETVAVYPDEDLRADLLPVSNDKVLSTLGKSSASEIRRRTGRQEIFARGYSLPVKIVANDDRVVTLNYDGSLSWYNASSRNALGSTAIALSGKPLFDR